MGKAVGEPTPATALNKTASFALLAAGANRFVERINVRVSAAAAFNIRHGTGDGDALIIPVEFSSAGASGIGFGGGRRFKDGVWIEVVSGTIVAMTAEYYDE